LTPALFARAAARAGFSSKVVRRPLLEIDEALMPVILLLQDNSACLLLGWDQESGAARLLFPETGQGTVSMTAQELQDRYSGVAIFSRPHFRFDQRTPRVAAPRDSHWFWSAILEQRSIFKDVLAAALLVNLFGLGLPLFTMNVYDRVVPNFAEETLWVLALSLVLVQVLDYVIRLVRGHFVDLASARVDLKLSALIMERVLGMRLSERPPSVGAFASNLRSFETVRDFIASATVTTLIDLPFTLLFLVVLAWISWPLVFLPMLAMIVVIIYGYGVQKKMFDLTETTFRAAAMRNATLVESLTGLETIKAHGAESRMQAKWEKTTAFLARVTAQLRLMSASSMNSAASIQQFVSVAIVVAGVYLIHERMLSMGGLIAATTLSSRAMAPLGQLVGLLLQYQNAKTALTALAKVVDTPGERTNESAYVHREQFTGDIEFRDVHFSYPGSRTDALRGVSFRIKPGEKVLVLGRVGSGKSTLQKLMLGLFAPTKGAILLDGVDMRQLDPADIRRNIGYVEQDSLLFYGTLRENITIRAPYVDDSTVIAAAEMAGLSEFVNRHPDGFDMLVGERGESLSGGQRQGVAIARAILLDPPVMLLDEPTSSMDFTSEMQIKEQFRTYAKHKTMVIVTHRSTLIDLADRIIVMDDGRIVADGPREKVVAALKAGEIARAA
jgi:ATP-binding cassette subfamily C protein LapB